MNGSIVFHQVPVLAVTNNALHAPHPGSHYGRSAGQGFQGHQPKALVVGGNDADICCAVIKRQVFLPYGAYKCDSILNIQIPGQTLQPFLFGLTIVIAADHHQSEITPIVQNRHSHQQPVYALQRLNTAYEQNYAAAVEAQMLPRSFLVHALEKVQVHATGNHADFLGCSTVITGQILLFLLRGGNNSVAVTDQLPFTHQAELRFVLSHSDCILDCAQRVEHRDMGDIPPDL